VSPGHDFPDARYQDFLTSAVAIGAPLAAAGTRALGATIRAAIETTARWTRSNTNLGIVLLLAPLARAALTMAVGDLRDSLRRVLDETDVEDARNVYAAIRMAAPGGLGRTDEQDVSAEPTVSLLDAMRLAAGRDSIAREYATAFEITFEVGVPALDRARESGLSWDDSILETFLVLLGSVPDTHIARRGGADLSTAASRLARAALNAGGVRSEWGRHAIGRLNRELCDPGHIGNPGTTADLTAAAIFVTLLRGGWMRRRPGV
jgi:triphosphoribosyl-dephospho-CoA synthase